jgi:prepilin peptidase CpaA
MSLPIPLLSPLVAGLMWATVCDLQRRRIPNAVSGAVFVTGLAISGYHGGASALFSGLAAALLLLVVLYKPWQAGGIGGGDVKLAAAVGAWIGLRHLIWFALATAVAGGIVAAVCYFLAPPATRADVRANLVLAGLHGELPPEAAASHRKTRVSVPYALAISAGAAVALLVA